MESKDLGLLVALDALLQEGSVTGAARRVGLSTPAMSHALARIRERLEDPILVRSGRGMLLTPRATALKARVHDVVAEARHALEPLKPFAARDMSQTFVVHASDYVLAILGGAVDEILHEEAPSVCVRFVPNTPEDPLALQDDGSDMAVGIYGDLPPEMRSRQLLTDRFVCVVRKKHPTVTRSITLQQFVNLPHVQVAPRGLPGGYIDDVLRQRGHERKVARAVPYFLSALHIASNTDYVLTVSERIAKQFAATLALEILEPPFKLRPYALSLVWHPRVDSDPGHRFLREAFARAARTVANDRHAEPRTRLDRTDPNAALARRGSKRLR